MPTERADFASEPARPLPTAAPISLAVPVFSRVARSGSSSTESLRYMRDGETWILSKAPYQPRWTTGGWS